MQIPKDSKENLYFHIQTGEIWQFILDYRTEHKEDEYLIPKLFEFMKQVILQIDQEPFMTLEQYNKGEVNKSYYEHYVNLEKKFDDNYRIDFFSKNGDFYEFTNLVIVRKGMVKYNDFARLFYLKLYTYKDDEYLLDIFLRFHYIDNFYGNLSDYVLFLNIVNAEMFPLDYSGFITNFINTWIDSVMPQKIPIKPLNKEIAKNKVNEKNDEIENKMIPEGYQIISTVLTKEELLNRFSFLYKEMSEEDKPFLPEENVRLIFKYGLAIPPAPLENKFALNSSFRYPKQIVDCAIYKLYRECLQSDKKVDKTQIILFFAHYLKDYEKALEGKLELNLIISNLTGELPKRIKFKMGEYINYEKK